MRKEKIIKETVTDIIDNNGVINSSISERIRYIESEPPYVKLYLDAVLYLKDLPRSYSSVLIAILKRMASADSEIDKDGLGGQEVLLPIAHKRRISVETGLTVKTINNTISALVKSEILYRTDKAIYTINPHIFGKGEWRNIKKLRMQVEFSAEGSG